VAAVREDWYAVEGLLLCRAIGRGVDDSRRHGACDRAIIEGRIVCLSTFNVSREGALGTILVLEAESSWPRSTTALDVHVRCAGVGGFRAVGSIGVIAVLETISD
jgi:hypothetical protein